MSQERTVISNGDVKIPWSKLVQQYVEDLSTLVDHLDTRLDNLRLSTIEAGPSKIEPSLVLLATGLEKLEAMVVRRDALLRDESAPSNGLTLTAKLLSTRSIDDARLSRRCREVSAAVSLVNARATSLFVCHYHLHGITSDLVRTITGDMRSSTYGRGGNESSPPRGGIFDDAA